MSYKLRPAETKAEKMLKVDHAGENGAVNIYRAQRLVSYFRKPGLVSHLRHNQDHEEEHRKIFAKELQARSIRKCASYHFCGLGGFSLGFVTGLIGPKAVAATTYAVEHVVLDHLDQQLLYLGDADQQAYRAVKAIYDDEKSHHDDAKTKLGDPTILEKCLVQIVKLCTEAVIRFGMR